MMAQHLYTNHNNHHHHKEMILECNGHIFSSHSSSVLFHGIIDTHHPSSHTFKKKQKTKKMNYQSFVVFVTLVCQVHATCNKIDNCLNCLGKRCVWYESGKQSFCGNANMPKSAFTTKIRSAFLCPSEYALI